MVYQQGTTSPVWCLVLIDVDSTILQEDKLWYYFPRKVSRTPGGAEVKIDETTRQKYQTGQQDHFDIWISQPFSITTKHRSLYVP